MIVVIVISITFFHPNVFKQMSNLALAITNIHTETSRIAIHDLITLIGAVPSCQHAGNTILKFPSLRQLEQYRPRVTSVRLEFFESHIVVSF